MTWDWTQASRTIGEHTTHLANEPVIEEIYFQVIILNLLNPELLKLNLSSVYTG